MPVERIEKAVQEGQSGWLCGVVANFQEQQETEGEKS